MLEMSQNENRRTEEIKDNGIGLRLIQDNLSKGIGIDPSLLGSLHELLGIDSEEFELGCNHLAQYILFYNSLVPSN